MRAARCWRSAVCVFLVAIPAAMSAQDAEARFAGLGLEEGRPPSAEAVRELKRRATALRAARGVVPRVAAASASVDCSKGKSLQAAIDGAESGGVIEVRGLCHENVRIEGKALTLRGTDPNLDGIRGVAPAAGVVVDGVLTVVYSDGTHVERLSIENGTQAGVQLFYAQVTMDDCRVSSNAAGGIRASAGSSLAGSRLVLADNGGNGLLANRGAGAFCVECELSGNSGFAAHAARGALLSLLDSTVSGTSGILSQVGAYADVDCLTEATTHLCSLGATAPAAIAFDRSVAALLGVEEFTGSLEAEQDSQVALFDSTQLSASGNFAGDFSRLMVDGSRLRGGTVLAGFARALLVAATVDGSVTCGDAADAVATGGLTLTPGSSVSGCEHVP